MAHLEEIEFSEPSARAAVSALVELPDFKGERMVLNMGPSHPSTHGVLRIVLELDGEIITRAVPEVGYLHRGDEKIAENMTYTQFIPYTDRLDYLAPLANNVAYAYAVEKLCGIDVPARCKYIRVVCAEMARISSHLLGVGALSMDLGAILRASGVEWDVRKAHPYGGYENFQFDIPTGTVGDCMDRYLVRMEEMRQSIRIIQQALDNMPGGEWNAPEAKIVLPEKQAVLTKMEELIHHFINVTQGINAPVGEIYFSAENPKGELGFYIVSRGGGTPNRLKIRAPSFVNLSMLPYLLPGHLISDAVAILPSLDFVMGESDR